LIGIDSNVLLRAVLDDDRMWSDRARTLVARHCTPETPGCINLLVLAEICWVLKRRPEFGRAELADVVQGLLEADNIVLEEEEAILRALNRFRRESAGFIEYLISEINARNGASPTYTIDRDAARNGAFEIFPKGPP
jgi:predicted nucleic-acid-binding protein